MPSSRESAGCERQPLAPTAQAPRIGGNQLLSKPNNEPIPIDTETNRLHHAVNDVLGEGAARVRAWLLPARVMRRSPVLIIVAVVIFVVGVALAIPLLRRSESKHGGGPRGRRRAVRQLRPAPQLPAHPR